MHLPSGVTVVYLESDSPFGDHDKRRIDFPVGGGMAEYLHPGKDRYKFTQGFHAVIAVYNGESRL